MHPLVAWAVATVAIGGAVEVIRRWVVMPLYRTVQYIARLNDTVYGRHGLVKDMDDLKAWRDQLEGDK